VALAERSEIDRPSEGSRRSGGNGSADGVVPGKQGVLDRYLEHRHADVTVLTFGQIEDLLGFALPRLARTYEAWWTLGRTWRERRMQMPGRSLD